MSTALQQPRHWAATNFRPLNTRPLSLSTGATYKVLFASPQGNPRRITANQNSTGVGMFTTPWVDATRFETDVLGYSTYVPGQKYLNRRTPLRHGDPAQTSLYLDSLEIISYHNFDKFWHECMTVSDGAYSKGWPKSQMIGYRGTFSQRPYLIAEDADVSSAAVPELKRYITKFPETESFHRKVPGFGFAFDGDAATYCDTLGSLPEFHQRWIYTSYFWPVGLNFGTGNSLPLGVLARWLGCVNDAVFDPDVILTAADGSTLNGFPTEELKFEDFRLTQPYYGSDDKLYCDLQCVFLWNPFNWNKQVKPTADPSGNDRGYTYVQQIDANRAFYSPARRPYRKVDFNRLFKPRGAP